MILSMSLIAESTVNTVQHIICKACYLNVMLLQDFLHACSDLRQVHLSAGRCLGEQVT